MYKTALTTLFSLCLLAPAHALDWAAFQGGGSHHGFQDFPEISQPVMRWQAPIGIMGYLNNPLVVGDMVYVGHGGEAWDAVDNESRENREGVVAFDLISGKVQWQYFTHGDVNGIAYRDGKIVFATGATQYRDGSGTFGVLDSETGAVNWTRATEGLNSQVFQPMIIEDILVMGDGWGNLKTYDFQTGKPGWALNLKRAIRAKPAWDGQYLYVASTGGKLLCLTLAGEKVWETQITHAYPHWSDRTDQFPVEIYGAPTLVDKKLIIGYARNTTYTQPALIALDKHTGQEIWRASDPKGLKKGYANIRSSPALAGHLLIWGEAYSNQVVAASVDTGEVVWVSAVGSPTFPQWASPAVAQNTVYIPRFDGGIYALDVPTGAFKWAYYLGHPDWQGPQLPTGMKTLKKCRQPDWKPCFGDAVYSSPALVPDGSLIIGAAGRIYRLGQKIRQPLK